MSQPYVGEIRLFGFSRVPSGWFACDGSLKSIADYQVLYTLLGTSFGGDGVTTFGVPDLRGRVPMHWGTGSGLSTRILGQKDGLEAVTLTVQQMPAHTHTLAASTAAAVSTSPTSAVPAAIAAPDTMYITESPSIALNAGTIGLQGGGQAHENRAPILTANFCIAAYGVFPSQN